MRPASDNARCKNARRHRASATPDANTTSQRQSHTEPAPPRKFAISDASLSTYLSTYENLQSLVSSLTEGERERYPATSLLTSLPMAFHSSHQYPIPDPSDHSSRAIATPSLQAQWSANAHTIALLTPFFSTQRFALSTDV